jgi:hypothetical protein
MLWGSRTRSTEVLEGSDSFALDDSCDILSYASLLPSHALLAQLLQAGLTQLWDGLGRLGCIVVMVIHTLRIA